MPDLDLDALLDELDDEVVVEPTVNNIDDWGDSEDDNGDTKAETLAKERPHTPQIPKNEPVTRPMTATPITDSNPEGIEYSEDMMETMDDTKSYIRDLFDFESQIADLKDEIKARKETAKEEGVKVGNAAKAVRELLKEVKETSDEAKGVEEMKRLIKEDDNLYSTLVAKTAK